MTKTVRRQETIPARVDTLFAFVSDHRHAEVFIDGLEQLRPLGKKTKGEGAEFEAKLKVGASSFTTTIVIAAIKAGRSITWSAVANGGQSLTFDLRPQKGSTRVDLAITYEEPGGVAGAIAAPFIERTVEHRADSSLKRLREHFLPAR